MVQHRLIKVAISVFGAKGLDGASTRGIAAAAGTAMSSITYHYGGKEGLYMAAADYIAAEMDDLLAGFPALGELPEDPAAARALVHAMLSRFLDTIAAERTTCFSMFILREQMNPTRAFDRLFEGAMGRLVRMLVEGVSLATGIADPVTARLTALALFGQVLVLRAARATCSRLIERDPADPGLVEDFRARMHANTDAILDRMISERQEPQ